MPAFIKMDFSEIRVIPAELTMCFHYGMADVLKVFRNPFYRHNSDVCQGAG